MAKADKQNDQTTPGERELPEAFTMNTGKKISPVTQPAAAQPGEADKVREGSEESFPASDPPATMQQTTLPTTPVKPKK